VVYNTWDFCIFGLCPLSSILKNETGNLRCDLQLNGYSQGFTDSVRLSLHLPGIRPRHSLCCSADQLSWPSEH
jgi:hypothetical protein